jgi:hypothetical protein
MIYTMGLKYAGGTASEAVLRTAINLGGRCNLGYGGTRSCKHPHAQQL